MGRPSDRSMLATSFSSAACSVLLLSLERSSAKNRWPSPVNRSCTRITCRLPSSICVPFSSVASSPALGPSAPKSPATANRCWPAPRLVGRVSASRLVPPAVLPSSAVAPAAPKKALRSITSAPRPASKPTMLSRPLCCALSSSTRVSAPLPPESRSLPPPPRSWSLPLPPSSWSLPPAPSSTSLPPRPSSRFAPPLPSRRLSASWPVRFRSAVPSRRPFSRFAPRVKSIAPRTSSTPSPASSISVAPAASSSYTSLPAPPATLSPAPRPSRLSLPRPACTSSTPALARRSRVSALLLPVMKLCSKPLQCTPASVVLSLRFTPWLRADQSA